MSLDMDHLADLALDRREETEKRWRELRRISMLWLTAAGAMSGGDARMAPLVEAALALPETASYETIRAALGLGGWPPIAEEPPAAAAAPSASARPPPPTHGHTDRGVP